MVQLAQVPETYRPPEVRVSRGLDPETLRELIVPGSGGRRVFRILMKNACRFACGDCPMKDQDALSPELLEPARIARLFLIAYRRGWCDGVFITSGVARTSVWAMEKTLELVETLRVTLGFRGYIHVKAAEGAEPGQLERLLRLVDRVSQHPEARCAEASEAAEAAEVAEAAEAAEAAEFAEPHEIAQALTRRSADAPAAAASMPRRPRALPSRSAGPQGSWRRRSVVAGVERSRAIRSEKLLHDYGFTDSELAFHDEAGLPVADPKLSWALSHRDLFPVEVTTATREELQRVPGLGPRSVEWILAARAHGKLSTPEDLDALGPPASRAAGFLLIQGRLVGLRIVQPTLFESVGA